MAKKAARPAEAVPVPAAAHANSNQGRKKGPLLTFLIVLLVLVGIVVAILWGVIAYCLLRGGGNAELPQPIVVSAGPTDSGGQESGDGTLAGGGEQAGGETPDESTPPPDSGEEDLEPLETYFQDMGDVYIRQRGAADLFQDTINGIAAPTPSDIAELMDQITPVLRQVVEDAEKTTSDDPEIRALHQSYLELVQAQLKACEEIASLVRSDDPDSELLDHAIDTFDQGAEMDIRGYMYDIKVLAQERGVDVEIDESARWIG